MLNYVSNETNLFLNSISKEDRKKIGQFFTDVDVAKFMAKLYVPTKKHLDILDPGSGSGILSAAIISELENTDVESISLTLYENDSRILPLLQNNLKFISENTSINLKYEIIEENYILNNSFSIESQEFCKKEYDLVIANPPYFKISRKAPEAQLMESICYGAPNIYFLFMAMSLHHLSKDSEMVFIVPRSWTSGAYFKKFREYLLSAGKIKQIHLFVSRDNVFNKQNVLQETIIIHVIKSKKPLESIKISSSSNNDFTDIDEFEVPYNLAISNDENHFVYLPTNKEEVKVLNDVHKFDSSFLTEEIKLRTGLTVDFRNNGYLEEKPSKDNVPLIYPFHFNNNFINFPIEHDKKQYVNMSKNGLIQENKDYLFLKRFTSKEEKRRLQPAIYLKEDFSNYDYISTENKINFIESTNVDDLSKEQIYGLFVIFNSTLYDKYYRILNGSTQVNANEINSLNIPSRSSLEKLGRILINKNDYSVKSCDEILESIL